MRFTEIGSLASLLAILSFAAGCGGAASPPPPPPSPPPPSITSLSPNRAVAGGPAFTLTINGTNLLNGATVQWNNSARTTTFVSGTQLTVPISAADIAAPGSASVQVVNPGSSSGTSNSQAFPIDPGNPAPSIAAFSPSQTLVGGPDFTLTITGDFFVSGATVQWDGFPRATTFDSSTQLRAQILATDISKSGLHQVTVVNPFSFPSNAANILVNDPTPVLTSLSPTSAVAGGAGFTLTVNGSDFLSSAKVFWNGVLSVPTAFVSSQQVTATISSSLFDTSQFYAGGGYALIAVRNPNSADSNILNLIIQSPAPQIASLSPASVMAGAAPLTLTVKGSGFFAGATLLVDGSPRQISAQTSTQLQTAIPASELAVARSIPVTVVNREPTVGPSNQVAFTVSPLTSNPVPILTSASETSVPAGWPGFRLIVQGTDFVASSVVQWNGADRPTTAASSTLLQAAIPGSDLASSGTAQVAVSNPGPGGGTSATLPVTIRAVPPEAVGVIERSSIANDFSELGSSGPAAVSGDGRFVVFNSSSVFLRDTCLGAAPGCVPSVSQIPSVSSVRGLAISANGRFVSAFEGIAGIFDTCFGAPAGCVQMLIAGSPRGDSLSADGRFAASVFVVTPTTCDENDNCFPATYAVYLIDTCAGVSSGCTPNTQAITPEGSFRNPAISPDGRFVAFEGGSFFDSAIFLYDSCQGAPAGCTPSETGISTPSPGQAISQPSVSAGGRYVAFATRLFSDSSGTSRVYLRDTCLGAPAGCIPETREVSVPAFGLPLNGSFDPSMSADGRFIAFASSTDNLVPGDTNGVEDIFLRDTCVGVSSGCTPSTIRVSIALDGTQGNGRSFSPKISADGRFIVFTSEAKLGPGVTNGTSVVYLARH